MSALILRHHPDMTSIGNLLNLTLYIVKDQVTLKPDQEGYYPTQQKLNQA